MHYDKIKDNKARGLIKHIDRGLDSEDNINHSNTNIDKTKTCLNYSLIKSDETANERYTRILDNVKQSVKENTGKNVRKDAVTLCTWVVTAPKDLPEDKHEDFFKGVYDYFGKRYGKENVVYATVHNDETTPHLHFGFVPVVEDAKGFNKLKANNLETPNSLRFLHRDMQNYLENELNCPVNLLNGATASGNKSIEELKGKSLREENEALNAKNEALVKSVNEKTEKALAYDVKDKGFFESKADYEKRKQAHEQATAVKQRSDELDQRETQLNERETKLDEEITHKANKKANQIVKQLKTERETQLTEDLNKANETIRQQQLTINRQLEKLKEYREYDNVIAKYKIDKRRSALGEVSSMLNNTYTFSNDEHYDHSL